MSGRMLTDLADVCRRAGLNVREVDGWQARARSSGGYADGRPWCIMWHHTASQTSAENDVSYIVSGSSDSPLSNLYLARDGVVWVCAAGATNTNGKGGPLPTSRGTVPADSMNTYAIGIEAGNNGVGEQWPAAQIDAYFALNNALAAAYGLLPTDCASHAAWAPGRKVDPATAPAVQGTWHPRSINANGTWSVEDIRSESVRRSSTAPPTKEGLVFTILAVMGSDVAFGGNMDEHGIAAQITWLSPTRYDACLNLGAPIVTVNPSDVVNCDLLGQIPPGFAPENFANVIQ